MCGATNLFSVVHKLLPSYLNARMLSVCPASMFSICENDDLYLDSSGRFDFDDPYPGS